jgi:hypothetical protein
MTLRIDKGSEGPCAILRLIGRIKAEYLEELAAQIRSGGPNIALDLDEVTLVDLQVVHFLPEVEGSGIELRHCPLFIREWMIREQEIQELEDPSRN